MNKYHHRTRWHAILVHFLTSAVECPERILTRENPVAGCRRGAGDSWCFRVHGLQRQSHRPVIGGARLQKDAALSALGWWLESVGP